MTVPADPHPLPVQTRMPWLALVLLACAALALAGGLSRRPLPSIAAAVLLLLAWLPAVCRRRSVGALATWGVLAALLLVPGFLGHAPLALMIVPVVFLAAIAGLFARTLRAGREPLVSRFVRLTEGEAQLALPGVGAYTRGVTVFWAWLLGALAALSLAIALLAEPGGWLATFGLRAPVTLPGSLLAWYPEAGCWIVLAAAFAGEYAFRRWRLRHVAQPSAWRFVVRMVRCWPALIRNEDGTG